MKHPGRSRMTRPAIHAVGLAFCATLIPASAMAAGTDGAHTRSSASTATGGSAHGRTRILGFNDDPARVMLGGKVKDAVTVVPKARRTVLVQARQPGSSHFVTQSSGHSAANGAFRATFAPTTAGSWQFRLLVLPSATKRSATSDTRVVRAVDVAAPRAVTKLRVAGVSRESATLSWVNPTDKGFTGVTIRRAEGATAPTSQVSGTAVTDTDLNGTTFTDTRLTADTTYTYALFAHDGSGNYSRATVTTLRTGRFGVTGLEATTVRRTSVTLAWVNPTDNAFTGVIVRRADGPTPPSSATEGTAVDDVASPEDSITDNGLTPGTTYSYAVFAHDGAQHVAGAVTATVTTRGNGVSAVLSINPLPSVHTGDRVTVGTEAAFDGSESLPTVGTEVAAWEINFGDHITESFNGRLSSFDSLNTRHAYTDTGAHTVTLTVTESTGHTDTTTLTVDVLDAPKVSISTPSSSPEAGAVPFEVKAETPPDTAITSWQMVVTGDDSFFIDGDSAPPTSQDVTFAPGSYTVVLSVTNDAGGSAVSDVVEVEVP